MRNHNSRCKIKTTQHFRGQKKKKKKKANKKEIGTLTFFSPLFICLLVTVFYCLLVYLSFQYLNGSMILFFISFCNLPYFVFRGHAVVVDVTDCFIIFLYIHLFCNCFSHVFIHFLQSKFLILFHVCLYFILFYHLFLVSIITIINSFYINN